MTVVNSYTGYGGFAYGSVPYGSGTNIGSSGLQFEVALSNQVAGGLQFEAVIADTEKPEGVQFNATNIGYNCVGYGASPYGSTNYGTGDCTGAAALQFTSEPDATPFPGGVQFDAQIADYVNPNGVQFFTTNLGFYCPGYGQVPYGSEPYSQTNCLASGAVQFEAVGLTTDPEGFQFESLVEDFLNSQGVQLEAVIEDYLNAQGMQFDALQVDTEQPHGVQFTGQIVDYLNDQGLQFEAHINALGPEGIQFDAIAVTPSGLQFTVNLYNTNRLRVLCEFPSRGDDDATGFNAWLLPAGEGNNWIANSQASGDFEAFRLNTDIVEEVWRSAGAVTGVTLDCDTEVAQGVFLDTLAILNHNLTSSAVVTLIGSNSPSFAPIGVSRVLNTRLKNIYHIEEDLPLTSYRYWRIQINDPTNTAGYLEIGTIVFGAAEIFQGECIIDRIMKRRTHFADTVRTEGFTSVKNDRSIKTAITLTFEKLEFNKGNFQTLDAISETARTAQKCLWIPTPSPTDPSFNERFAVFAKMTSIPEQQHLVMGPEEGDYIDLVVELDEAE